MRHREKCRVSCVVATKDGSWKNANLSELVVSALWHHSPVVEEAVIPILRAADAEVAVGWYARLGFRKESEHRFAPGLPAFVTVARGSIHLFLSEHTGDARPATLIHLQVTNVDAIAAEFGVGPEDEPLGPRDQVERPGRQSRAHRNATFVSRAPSSEAATEEQGPT